MSVICSVILGCMSKFTSASRENPAVRWELVLSIFNYDVVRFCFLKCRVYSFVSSFCYLGNSGVAERATGVKSRAGEVNCFQAVFSCILPDAE